MEVILDAKDNQKTLLGLNYYSNSLLQQMIMDSTMGYLINRHFSSPETMSQSLPL